MRVGMIGEQANEASMDLDLDPRVLEELRWTGFWPQLKQRMEEELAQTRKVRPLLQVICREHLDPDAIPDFRVDGGNNGAGGPSAAERAASAQNKFRLDDEDDGILPV